MYQLEDEFGNNWCVLRIGCMRSKNFHAQTVLNSRSNRFLFPERSDDQAFISTNYIWLRKQRRFGT